MNKHLKGLLDFFLWLARVLFWIVGVPVIMWHVWKLYGWYVVDYKPYRGMKFSQEAWKNNNRMASIDNRCKMYTDLTQNYLRKGMTKKEIIELLGQWRVVSYCLEKK